MFGSDMLGKLQEMQKAAEESKKRLDDVIVRGESGSGLVEIELTANRNFKRISIHAELSQMEKEDLEDLISVAFERALKQANEVHEREAMASARNFMPGL